MPPKSLKKVSLKEFDKHNKEEDCWIAYNGEVVDVNNYLAEHPGGIDAITDFAARDATSAFDAIGHSESAKTKMREYVVGVLSDEDRKVVEARSPSGAGGAATVVIIILLICIALYFILA